LQGGQVLKLRSSIKYFSVLAVSLALAIGFARTSPGESAEAYFFDLWHVLAGVRYAPANTALVVVDDETLVALKDDPIAFWAPHFGKALETIDRAGARVVGLDFLYQVSAESWLRKLNLPDSEVSRNYDGPLRAALASGNKILISHLVQPKSGEPQLLLPPRDQLYLLQRGISDLGIANLHTDVDRYVRHFFPFLDPDPSRPGVAFGMQLALRAAEKDPLGKEWEIAGQKWSRDARPFTIRYAGPPGTVPAVPMSALLTDDATVNPQVRALKGRVVIVAATDSGSTDRQFTPYSRGAGVEPMSGGEIHANIVETILSGRLPRPLSTSAELGYLLLLIAFATALFFRFDPAPSAIFAAGIALLAAVPAYAAFHMDWMVPVAEPQAGVLAAFLLTLSLRRRIRQIFGRYVSDEIVEKLLSEGRRPDLAGELHTVTVLFSDIRNFTTLSEKLNAHEVVEMLNAYFARVCEPILAQGGTVDKYIGDAVMAVFGSPVAHPDHARRALRAALGMATAAGEFKSWMASRFPERQLPDFAIGIGINTGEAVIGDIGTPKRMEFTAIGDTVNAASRLESATKELGYVIAAGESSVTAAGPGVTTGKVQDIVVKGKTAPIRVYEIISLGA
jgi:adenylate cyclase